MHTAYGTDSYDAAGVLDMVRTILRKHYSQMKIRFGKKVVDICRFAPTCYVVGMHKRGGERELFAFEYLHDASFLFKHTEGARIASWIGNELEDAIEKETRDAGAALITVTRTGSMFVNNLELSHRLAQISNQLEIVGYDDRAKRAPIYRYSKTYPLLVAGIIAKMLDSEGSSPFSQSRSA